MVKMFADNRLSLGQSTIFSLSMMPVDFDVYKVSSSLTCILTNNMTVYDLCNIQNDCSMLVNKYAMILSITTIAV